MINPQTISEQMLYSTIRLAIDDRSTGTGFFFVFEMDDGLAVPVIITNKHVVNNESDAEVVFFLHTKTKDGVGDEKINIKFKTKWFSHPSQDMCFCFVQPLFKQIKKEQGKEVFYSPITEDLIWNKEKLEELSVIEDVVMVGYPTGLWDQKHNLPLFRSGITSSHPSIDFNREGVGVVDMACYPGSSGSPIFILNENGYSDKRGNSYLGSTRVILLGVLFEGPQFNARGDLIVEQIPMQQKVAAVTSLMINLGYYIKANEILHFKEIIKKIIDKK